MMRGKYPSGLWSVRVSVLFLVTVLAIATGACAADYTDEEMEPLAGTATDLARAVRDFVKKHPEEAASLNDQDLVTRATAHDANLLAPYAEFAVMGNAEGIILVCTKDKARGLIEDAECSDKVDGLNWRNKNAPCRYTLDVAAICPGM